jgi:pyrroline-5-carboxylate reductase
MTARLVVVGGGQMGEALLLGLVDSGWAPAAELVAVDVSEERRVQLAAHGIDARADVPACADAVVAVKPADVPAACVALAAAGVRRVLSIAAGVTLAKLESVLGDDVAVVRAMPNTPALLRCGAAAIAAGAAATDDDLAWAEGVLGAVGLVVRVREPLLDAVTGVSGSGPAYVFLLAEALVEAGVAVGLTWADSAALANRTLLGAARMIEETGDSPNDLRRRVTSPGGTTAAAVRALEDGGFRAAVHAAVAAATERSRELGRA